MLILAKNFCRIRHVGVNRFFRRGERNGKDQYPRKRTWQHDFSSWKSALGIYQRKISQDVKRGLIYSENQRERHEALQQMLQGIARGRTFDEVIADDTVWINYEPRTDRGWYGITISVGGKDVSISQSAFIKGKWWVAGTLVHELAHVNGASASTGDADNTLLCCGLKNMYEGAIGMKQSGTTDDGSMVA